MKSAKKHQGITLVEILVVVSVLIVIVSVASPSLNGVGKRMQLLAAAENVEHSIGVARKTARRADAPVRLDIDTDPESGLQRLIVTPSNKARKRLSQPEMPIFLVDKSLALTGDHDSFEFDNRGIATNPGQISLSVRGDETGKTHFIIE